MTIDEVKQSYTMQDILNRYGLQADKRGFLNCPFHSEKTNSLRIYKKSFYCYGCGAGNSIIDFVMLMEKCSFADAIKKLGGDEQISFSAKRKLFKKQRIAENQETQRKKRDELYWSLMTEWFMLNKIKQEFKPAPDNDTPHPLFLQALITMPQIEQQLDKTEWW